MKLYCLLRFVNLVFILLSTSESTRGTSQLLAWNVFLWLIHSQLTSEKVSVYLLIFYLINVGSKNIQLKVCRRNNFPLKKKQLIKAKGPLKICIAADMSLHIN